MLIGPTAVVLALYISVTLALGWFAGKRESSTRDYLQATSALPLFIVLPAYMAANCGALEVVGLSAMAAHYGASAFHFFWIGAVPAMVVLATCLMRVYRKAGISTVPQFLEVRYGRHLRLINAVLTALIVLLLAGISMYAVGQVVSVITGVSFRVALCTSDVIVVTYVLLGGIRATLYNEVLQFGLLLVSLTPIAVKSLRILRSSPPALFGQHAHVWTALPLMRPHAPLDVFGVVIGLGCILSFSYWCTDFVMMQRAFTARTLKDAQRVPAFAAFGKIVFGFLIVTPGLAAAVALPSLQGRYDQALPSMMARFYSPWMLALGLTALCASLLSALAANVSAFATVLHADILPLAGSGLRLPGRSQPGARFLDGRVAVIFAGVAGLLLSSLNFFFSDLMELIQLIFSVLGVPFWSVFLIGMLSPSVAEADAMLGLACGSIASLLIVLLHHMGWFVFGSNMACDFYAAAVGFAITTGVTLVSSSMKRKKAVALTAIRIRLTLDTSDNTLWWTCGILLLLVIMLDVAWR